MVFFIGKFQAYPFVNNTGHVKSRAEANNCIVKTTWFGFYKIWKASNQIFDSVGLSIPSYSYDSQVYFCNSMFCSAQVNVIIIKIEYSVTKKRALLKCITVFL
jgi:hypothetical protein